MQDFAELHERIEAVCARASTGYRDAQLLEEINDVLAQGYICALRGDHRRRRLQKRVDALVDVWDDAGVAEELRAVAHEQRMVAEATQLLRAKLAVMHAHWAVLGGEELGLA
jgi:hypothetical protein